MDKTLFVQNIKFYCERKGVKPTNACRDSGAGASFISNIETRGQTPSVEKVEQLAHYLGTTVSVLIGETEPSEKVMTLRDSAVVIQPDDFRHLSFAEMDMVLAYRAASSDDKTIVDAALRKYKKGTTAETG